jgi:hypothetical protein
MSGFLHLHPLGNPAQPFDRLRAIGIYVVQLRFLS